MLAIVNAVETASILSSILFFLMFFLGTTIYFIPLPFMGAFQSFTNTVIAVGSMIV